MMSPMARLTGDMQRLARCIADRRAELRLTQDEVSDLGGPSPATQSLFENGMRDSMQATTAGDYEHAFGWAPGSVRRILAGGEPVDLHSRPTQPAPADDGEALLEFVLARPRLRRRLIDLARAAQLDQAEDDDEQRSADAG